MRVRRVDGILPLTPSTRTFRDDPVVRRISDRGARGSCPTPGRAAKMWAREGGRADEGDGLENGLRVAFGIEPATRSLGNGWAIVPFFRCKRQKSPPVEAAHILPYSLGCNAFWRVVLTPLQHVRGHSCERSGE